MSLEARLHKAFSPSHFRRESPETPLPSCRSASVRGRLRPGALGNTWASGSMGAEEVLPTGPRPRRAADRLGACGRLRRAGGAETAAMRGAVVLAVSGTLRAPGGDCSAPSWSSWARRPRRGRWQHVVRLGPARRPAAAPWARPVPPMAPRGRIAARCVCHDPSRIADTESGEKRCRIDVVSCELVEDLATRDTVHALDGSAPPSAQSRSTFAWFPPV